MIDFSALPLANKPKKVASPLRDFAIAAGIMLSVLAYMLFVLFILRIDDPNIGVLPVTILFMIGAIVLVVWVTTHQIRKPIRHREAVKRFAKANNFTYKQPKWFGVFETVDQKYIPPDLNFDPRRTTIPYHVSGQLDGNQFELYRLWGAPLYAASGYPVASATLLRTSHHIDPSSVSEKFVVRNVGDESFIVYIGNLFYREDMQELFGYVV